MTGRCGLVETLYTYSLMYTTCWKKNCVECPTRVPLEKRIANRVNSLKLSGHLACAPPTSFFLIQNAGKVLALSPGLIIPRGLCVPMRHLNALTEKAREEALQRLGRVQPNFFTWWHDLRFYQMSHQCFHWICLRKKFLATDKNLFRPLFFPNLALMLQSLLRLNFILF